MFLLHDFHCNSFFYLWVVNIQIMPDISVVAVFNSCGAGPGWPSAAAPTRVLGFSIG